MFKAYAHNTAVKGQVIGYSDWDTILKRLDDKKAPQEVIHDPHPGFNRSNKRAIARQRRRK